MTEFLVWYATASTFVIAAVLIRGLFLLQRANRIERELADLRAQEEGL